MRVRLRERDQRERLFEIIQNREIWTAFQPIVDMKTGSVVAWEGLSRGPRGSEVELPMVLFGQATRYSCRLASGISNVPRATGRSG